MANKTVIYPTNDKTTVQFTGITERQKDVLDAYQVVMKYLYKLEKQRKVTLKFKEDGQPKRSNSRKGTKKIAAKKSSRIKKI